MPARQGLTGNPGRPRSNVFGTESDARQPPAEPSSEGCFHLKEWPPVRSRAGFGQRCLKPSEETIKCPRRPSSTVFASADGGSSENPRRHIIGPWTPSCREQ